MGPQRVGHNCTTNICFLLQSPFLCWCRFLQESRTIFPDFGCLLNWFIVTFVPRLILSFFLSPPWHFLIWWFILSVQFSRSVMSDSLRPCGLQHARPPCPSPTPGVYSNSCPLSQWCHPAISSSAVPFSSYPQSLPASGSFSVSQLFTWSGQSIGVSASTSVLPMNTQDRSPLGWTAWISLRSKGLSRVFSNTIVQKHQFLSTQLSLQSNSHIHTWPLENDSLD